MTLPTNSHKGFRRNTELFISPCKKMFYILGKNTTHKQTSPYETGNTDEAYIKVEKLKLPKKVWFVYQWQAYDKTLPTINSCEKNSLLA